MDAIQRALSFDPIAEVEKACGNKHWSQFTEDEQGMSLGLALLHNQNKDTLLKESHDTRFSMTWDEFEEIVTSNGFKNGYEEHFPYDDHEEKAVMFYREDGLIIWVTSFSHMKRVNGGTMYGEIKLNSVKERSHIPSCSNGFYDFDNMKLDFDKDIREGLIWFISKMKEHGEFIPVWEKEHKFLCFLNFSEDEKNSDDYEKISKGKMEQFCDEAKKIVAKYI